MRDYTDVLICTPVRDGRFHTGYVVGLMSSNGLHNGWLPYSGQSDIYIARNVLTNAFLSRSQYQTMVCIDSDIGFSRQDFQDLLDSPGDVVSGLYTDKTQPPQAFCRDAQGNQVPPADIPMQGLIKSKFIPGGFFKIERHVLEDIVARGMVDNYGTEEKLVHSFYATRYATGGAGRFMCSEDFSLSVLLGEAGYQCWTNCGIRVNHDGREWTQVLSDE